MFQHALVLPLLPSFPGIYWLILRWASDPSPMCCSQWQQQRHKVLLVHLQQTSILFIRNMMHYPLLPCLVQAQWDHETPWPKNTEEGMQKVGLQFFLLLMFAEVTHINWKLAWCMHTSILKWLISQFKTLNLILKIQGNVLSASTVHQFQGNPDQPLQPLKHCRTTFSIFWTGMLHQDWVSGNKQL